MNIDILQFIPPAIAITIFAYLANFFGKVIADQQPFADDRKWHAQLNGGMFMLNTVLGGLVGVYLANSFPILSNNPWLHATTFIIYSITGSALFSSNSREFVRIYNYGSGLYESLDKKSEGFVTILAQVGRRIPSMITQIIVFYFGTLEYLSGNPYWTIATLLLGFYIFFMSAIQYSLSMVKELGLSDIYFTDSTREPLTSVKIIKINNDNIRVRMGNTIILINKAEILRIESEIPEKLR